MNDAININFRVNNSYSNYCRMRNNVFEIVTVLSTVSFNGYTLIEILNSSAFPIILALGSTILTTLLIIVQVRKLKLVKQQLKTEALEIQKKELEIKQLQEEQELKFNNHKVN